MSTFNEPRQQIEGILSTIKQELINKDEAVRVALLAAITGESIFFLGAPGTAKSLVSRRLKSAFANDANSELNYFEYLMNQFSTPDEVFGPVSLKSLEQDEYKRITTGYLPNADIAFLDEIWKASPAIQNTLLTIINERKFHNGNQVIEVPLKGLIAASNELPAKNQGLEALWDRFLIRMLVNPVQNDDDFTQLITSAAVKADLDLDDAQKGYRITKEQLSTWKTKIQNIEIPSNVMNVILGIRRELAVLNQNESREPDEQFYVSDRRWKKIANLLRASAFLNGRQQVDLMDCQIIEYCIWNTEGQIEEAKEIVRKVVQQNGLTCNTSIASIKAAINKFDQQITEQFYDEKTNPKKQKMKDGENAFILVKEENIKITTGYNSYNRDSYLAKFILFKNNKIRLYNDSKEHLATSYNEITYKVNHNKIIFTPYNSEYNLEIKTETSFIRKTSTFDNKSILKLLIEHNYTEHKKITDEITKEKEKAQKFKADNEHLFKMNLFADETFCDSIITSVTKSLVDLDKAKADLDNAKKRYE